MRLELEAGAPLRDVLFEKGVEFACGGKSCCRGCRIRLLEGELAPSPQDREAFTPEELSAGWRLACAAKAQGPLTVEIPQWELPVLSDESACPVEPEPGLGLAVDLGTTTVVAQLLDLSAGRVLSVQTGLNPQAIHGSDVMSRVESALAEPRTQTLEIRRCVHGMLRAALKEASAEPKDLRRVVLAGNSVMHHLFCGLSVEPFSHVPFAPVSDGLQRLSAQDLGWQDCGDPEVCFLPCLGGFVGSDILCGTLALGLSVDSPPEALMDLGTNGEILINSSQGMLCASTAAGPAFEAGRIRSGMRAATGAISAVSAVEGRLHCEVIGGGPARGLCGSGLVDAVAAGLELKNIEPSGKLSGGLKELPLAASVGLTQQDVRELQLAKAAMAAGMEILLERLDLRVAELRTVHLAGAFGNYIRPQSARRVGLLKTSPDRIRPAGNTALRGAKMVLLCRSLREKGVEELRARIRHFSLGSEARFQELFLENMAFPA